MRKKVRVHSGSAHVRGKARSYPYFIASLFVKRKTKAGHWVWRNSGIHTTPRRSLRLAEMDGRDLAKRKKASFVVGYGSLHNHEAEPEKKRERKRFNFPSLFRTET
jgi:hypothetical protein